MDQRTNQFLVGANVAAQLLFRELAPILEPRVLRVAIPLDTFPPETEPVVELHPQFTWEICQDDTFFNSLRVLGRLDDSSQSAEVARHWISTAISACTGADQFVHFCSYPWLTDKTLDSHAAAF
jgi:hypothetical protein